MGGDSAPTLTGVPFNDAYRYMDWLLTVPLLLIEILLVMNLPEAEYSSKAWTLGFGSRGCLHSDWLLLFRHHFQVRCWHFDLPDHICQVQQARTLAMLSEAFWEVKLSSILFQQLVHEVSARGYVACGLT